MATAPSPGVSIPGLSCFPSRGDPTKPSLFASLCLTVAYKVWWLPCPSNTAHPCNHKAFPLMASFPSQISVRKEKPVIYYSEVYVWKLNLVILSFSYKSTQHVFQHRQFFGT